MARVIIHHFLARSESEADAARFIRQVLREIRFQARLHASIGPYVTGELAQSIEHHGPFIEQGFRVSGSVGSNLVYASSVEGGAQRHRILPTRARHLRFYWRKVGRVVTLPRVNHPGQRPKRYLQRAAESVARRHNMLIIIREL